MKSIYLEIEQLIDAAILKLGIETKLDYLIERPADTINGDYSSNVSLKNFSLAKDLATNPYDFAGKIVDAILKDPLSKNIEKINVAKPGFINFYLSKNFFIDNMLDVCSIDKINVSNKRISLEHTQINPNKEPHIGHLRNACIGDALVNILRFTGNDVKVQYYQNDVGQQIASIVLAYKKQFVPFGDIKLENSDDVLTWASSAYVDIEKRIESSEDLKKEKETIQRNIVAQDTEDSKLAALITDAILKATLKLFGQLSIEYDLVVKESDILKNKLWQTTFELLKESNNFYLSQEGERAGCWLIKMPSDEDKVIVRSNGVPTYTGNDIAYHLWKFGVIPDFKYGVLDWGTQFKVLYSTDTVNGSDYDNKFNSADEIVNIIDNTQTYPQESVKEALRVLGYPKLADNYKHVNYGFVFLKDSSNSTDDFVKMSGRKGTVVTVSNFINLLVNSLRNQFGDFSAIHDVAYGVLKFEMLKYDTYQDVVFDIKSATDQKGFSGPYVQYAYARANSVISKLSQDDLANIPLDIEKYTDYSFNDSEMELLKSLSRFEDVVIRSSNELAPHYICNYLFELSKSFNSFYNSSKIVGVKEQEFRARLTLSVSSVLETCMKLLGISAPKSLK